MATFELPRMNENTTIDEIVSYYNELAESVENAMSKILDVVINKSINLLEHTNLVDENALSCAKVSLEGTGGVPVVVLYDKDTGETLARITGDGKVYCTELYVNNQQVLP